MQYPEIGSRWTLHFDDDTSDDGQLVEVIDTSRGDPGQWFSRVHFEAISGATTRRTGDGVATVPGDRSFIYMTKWEEIARPVQAQTLTNA